jgi:hypothetical protein
MLLLTICGIAGRRWLPPLKRSLAGTEFKKNRGVSGEPRTLKVLEGTWASLDSDNYTQGLKQDIGFGGATAVARKRWERRLAWIKIKPNGRLVPLS